MRKKKRLESTQVLANICEMPSLDTFKTHINKRINERTTNNR